MEAKRFLTAEEIISAPDLQEKDFYVKEWNGWVHLRELTAGDRDWIDLSMIAEARAAKAGEPNAAGEAKVIGKNAIGEDVAVDLFRVKLCVAGIVDPVTKKRIFTSDQVAELAGKNAAAILDIAFEVLTLSKMTAAEVKRVGEDSGRIQEGSSDSGSPESSDAPSESSTGDSQAQS